MRTPRSDWSSDHITFDPNAVMVALQARARPEGHWLRVQEWDRLKRRKRLLEWATLWVVVGLAGGAVAWWLR